MAYYAYKEVRDLIPNDFRDRFEESFKVENGREYDGDANYDGDMWLLAAAYIEHLQCELKAKENNGRPDNRTT